MDQMQKPSRRLIWVGIGGAVLVIVVIVTIIFAVVGSFTKKEAVTTTPSATEETVATKDEAKQNLATLDASVKQAAADQTAAKAALKANEKQIKVGN
jgi:hypothetical protein